MVLALAERDPDSLDSYYGPQAWRDDARAQHPSLADVRRSAYDALKRLEDEKAAANGPRSAFLVRQLRAVAARADLLTGVRRPFSEESRLLFGVDRPPVDAARAASIRASLDRLLPGRGDLTRRLAEFERLFVVPPSRLSQVLSRAMAECRRVTLEHVALPSDERVTIEYVGDLPWSAFTRYEGGHRSRITVNAAAGFTVDDVLQLACHEAYPGHHAIDLLVDDRLVRAAHRRELTVQALFSPQSLLAEGAASIAPEVAFTDADRLDLERSTLFPLAGIAAKDGDLAVRVARLAGGLGPVRAEIAARYVDGDLEFARAAAALEREGLMPAPDPMLKFLNEYRTYAVVYSRGPELAAAFLNAHAGRDAASRWAAYVQLVTTPAQAFETPLEPRK